MEIISFAHVLDEHNKERIKRLLEKDGIIVYPTDTLYGIGGNFFSPTVVKKIDALKGREDMPYSVAVPGIDLIKKLAVGLPEYFEKLARQIFPGKFTVLVEASPAIDTVLLKNSSKVGIRIPGLPALISLLEYLDMPLVTTSVNRSGTPPLCDPAEIGRQFPAVDLLIDAGVLPVSQGSTILDLTVSPFKIIRQGDDFDKISHLRY